ncbi:hypothetical protein L6452_33265 [Arctium lappa]|uniref:Uncharacterized protein n=1 Tax=Arctium lappa TaxID=4217 RepID=A0ACB8ZBH4_ARCLA|nr:hypothetical protein L6452_33265 [Arctium lappa]
MNKRCTNRRGIESCSLIVGVALYLKIELLVVIGPLRQPFNESFLNLPLVLLLQLPLVLLLNLDFCPFFVNRFLQLPLGGLTVEETVDLMMVYGSNLQRIIIQ